LIFIQSLYWKCMGNAGKWWVILVVDSTTIFIDIEKRPGPLFSAFSCAHFGYSFSHFCPGKIDSRPLQDSYPGFPSSLKAYAKSYEGGSFHSPKINSDHTGN